MEMMLMFKVIFIKLPVSNKVFDNVSPTKIKCLP
jgi:hypothetical protein